MNGILEPTKIEILQNEIKQVVQFNGLSQELTTFREVVLDGHAFLEEMLQSILSKHLFKTAHGKSKKGFNPAYSSFREMCTEFIQDFTFHKLVSIAHQFGIISDDVKRQLNSVSRARNLMVHQLGRGYLVFEDEGLREYTLGAIKNLLTELSEIDREYKILELPQN